MDVIKTQQISAKPIEKVIVHPLVLLSIVDNYNRVAKDTRKRVVGVLLGSSFKGTVDVTNSYAVPFEEDDKDPSIWFLDHNYHESMFSMFKRINAKEHVVGWYSTGPKLRENDLKIHGLFNDYVPNPVLVIIDVQPEELGIPTKAYYAVEEVKENATQKSQKVFVHVPSEIAAHDVEEIGVEHLLRDVKDTTISTLATEVTGKLAALKGLDARLKEIRGYLDLVIEGKLPLNHEILYHLQSNVDTITVPLNRSKWNHLKENVARIGNFVPLRKLIDDVFNLLPNLNVADLIKAFAVKTNDMMLVIYLSSLIRSVIALHNLISNKMLNKEHEKAEDSKPIVCSFCRTLEVDHPSDGKTIWKCAQNQLNTCTEFGYNKLATAHAIQQKTSLLKDSVPWFYSVFFIVIGLNSLFLLRIHYRLIHGMYHSSPSPELRSPVYTRDTAANVSFLFSAAEKSSIRSIRLHSKAISDGTGTVKASSFGNFQPSSRQTSQYEQARTSKLKFGNRRVVSESELSRVIWSIVDNYNRVAKDTRKRVVGVLLGSSFKGTVDATNSYAVPFEEDDKDPRIWFLDHNYHESMFSMFKRINAKEHVVGWYSTGPKLRENDLEIHGLFNDYVPNPVLVIIDVQPEELGIPTKAYYAVEEVKENATQKSQKVFVHVQSEIAAHEVEEIGVEHLLRDVKDTTISTLATEVTGKLAALKGLDARLKEIRGYLDLVIEEKLPLNHEILYHLQDVFNLLPNLNVADLIKAFAVKTNDMMLVIYLSSLIRSVIALHNLINNKMLNKEHEKAEDSKPVALPPVAGS
ncbi:hypothetical protein POTOM_031185 [Populus tomentosa]|uniref:MPN domain-containing protein n=1 Tax=Populus tomentosa TaxID=118781 RepID=A0A8X8CIA2_POPTO|nr:hypothetical protein POTOM_031185 [Populus tomentosa]